MLGQCMFLPGPHNASVINIALKLEVSVWSFPWKAAGWFLFHLHLRNRDQKSELNLCIFYKLFPTWELDGLLCGCRKSNKYSLKCGLWTMYLWRLGSVRDGRWTVKDMCSPGRLPDPPPSPPVISPKGDSTHQATSNWQKKPLVTDSTQDYFWNKLFVHLQNI